MTTWAILMGIAWTILGVGISVMGDRLNAPERWLAFFGLTSIIGILGSVVEGLRRAKRELAEKEKIIASSRKRNLEMAEEYFERIARFSRESGERRDSFRKDLLKWRNTLNRAYVPLDGRAVAVGETLAKDCGIKAGSRLFGFDIGIRPDAEVPEQGWKPLPHSQSTTVTLPTAIEPGRTLTIKSNGKEWVEVKPPLTPGQYTLSDPMTGGRVLGTVVKQGDGSLTWADGTLVNPDALTFGQNLERIASGEVTVVTTMTCPTCGKTPVASVFCPRCGTKLLPLPGEWIDQEFQDRKG